MWRTIAIFAVLISSMYLAIQAQQNEEVPAASGSASNIVELIQSDFKDCLIEPPHPRPRLYAQERFEFTGDAKRLNAFLSSVARLPSENTVTVYLCGPAHPVVEPLTSTVAQTAVEYDWKVQTLAENVSIFIPLASRIPFAEIQFPNELKLEAEPAVVPITEDFLRLREQEIGEQSRSLLPKE